ncbi:glycosyltransferase family 2 protein [Pseudanabaenaceae cyanobacterium LEGE 13415]|nr:glycosyltransferase family 2 protein [Pseudanabaenaceae cyanobacterium LEGE 13415]
MSLCEVRITTYKRPDLLKRAIDTLINQTYTDWKAIVLDDSPEQEGKTVVEAFNDARIFYKPNPQNLGRTRNLDYAFQSSAMMGGTYAFVLEDDNYLYPEFIEKNVRSSNTHNVALVMRNQEIRLEENGVSIPLGQTSRGRWFRTGLYSPFEVYARLFFCEGISNGGLFWRTDRIQSNLQVGSQIEDAWHQEIYRTLQIREPLFFEAEPLCVWTGFVEPQKEPDSLKDSLFSMPARYNKVTQFLLSKLIHQYGHPIVQVAAEVASERITEAIILERQLLNVRYLNYRFKHVRQIERVLLLLKNYFRSLQAQRFVRKLPVPSPLQD